MKNQNVFKRYEIKYMITEEQASIILAAMEEHMKLDRFGKSTIRNLYYDTDDFILARHSIEKPEFKEKLRVRSYAKATDDSMVFVELKRKFDSVVYKRRLSAPNVEAVKWLAGEDSEMRNLQVGKEIEYFVDYYKNLEPKVFLSYDREAYRMKDEGDDFRVTFDRDVIYRDYDVDLNSYIYGTKLLQPGMVLMELKCPGGIPLWMVKVLSELKVYKTSFSKYGTAYKDMMRKSQKATKNEKTQEQRRIGAAA